MKLALGYNPEFLQQGHYFDNIDLLELGLFEYSQLLKKRICFPFLSLHLARSPITESVNIQNEYINQITKSINSKDFISVGFHLVGNRFSNIGQFGFSPHYEPSDEYEKNAIRFLKNIQVKLNLDTWLENANFYSSSFDEIQKAYISLVKIAKHSSSKLIIDLSHLVIDSCNNNIDPSYVIGLIDWSLVTEIHLSGIIEDKNGVLHDGHSQVVDERVWGLLEKVLPLINDDTYINLEHTDPCLIIDNKIKNDIKKLNEILSFIPKKNAKNLKPLLYVESYYCKLMKNWIPGLEDALVKEELGLRSTVHDWMKYCIKENIKLSLTVEEILDSERSINSFAPDHFLRFIQDQKT